MVRSAEEVWRTYVVHNYTHMREHRREMANNYLQQLLETGWLLWQVVALITS